MWVWSYKYLLKIEKMGNTGIYVHQKFIATRKTRAPLHIFNIDDAKRVTTYKLADDTNVFR